MLSLWHQPPVHLRIQQGHMKPERFIVTSRDDWRHECVTLCSLRLWKAFPPHSHTEVMRSKYWTSHFKVSTQRVQHIHTSHMQEQQDSRTQRQTVSSLRLQRSADCFWPLACRHTGCPQTSRVLLWYSHFQEAAVSVSTNISLVGTRSSSVTTEHFQLLRDSRLFPTEKETIQWVDFHRHRGQQPHANCVNNTFNHSTASCNVSLYTAG